MPPEGSLDDNLDSPTITECCAAVALIKAPHKEVLTEIYAAHTLKRGFHLKRASITFYHFAPGMRCHANWRGSVFTVPVLDFRDEESKIQTFDGRMQLSLARITLETAVDFIPWYGRTS